MHVALDSHGPTLNVKHSLFAILRSRGLPVEGRKGGVKKNQFLVSKALCVCEDHCLRESDKRCVGIRIQNALHIHVGLFENLHHPFQYGFPSSLIKLTKLIGQVLWRIIKPVTSSKPVIACSYIQTAGFLQSIHLEGVTRLQLWTESLPASLFLSPLFAE